MGYRLRWRDLNLSEDGHRVYRSTSEIDPGNLPVPLAVLGPDITAYDDHTALDEVKYYYRVSAFIGAQEEVSLEVDTDAAQGDPHWGSVVSLLHFDGDIIDQKGHLWGLTGSAAISSEHPRFGSGALHLPAGIGDASTTHIPAADRNWYADSYTIEAHIMPIEFKQDNNGRPMFIHEGVAIPGVSNWQFGPILNGKLAFTYWSGVVSRFESAEDALQLDEYQHIAFCHSKPDQRIRLFARGVKLLDLPVTAPPAISASTGIYIGLRGLGPGDGKTRGEFDEFRITKGVARYTENFAPPVQPFPNFGPLGATP